MRKQRILALLLGAALAGSLIPAAAAAPAEGSSSMTLDRWTVRSAEGGASLQEDSQAWQAARADILQAALNWESEVNIAAYGIPEEELDDLFFGLYFQHPELFYLRSAYSYTFHASGGRNLAYSVIFEYNESYTKKDLAVFDAAVERVLARLPEDLSELETVAALHDWLAARCAYDYDFGDSCRDAYGALVKGKAVCQGYSLALMHLLRQRGIESCYVSSEEANHGWLEVRIDGAWRHVDVTLDDSSLNTEGVPRDIPGRVMHQDLLRSDSGIAGTSSYHRNWAAAHPCADTTYDGWFWQDVTSRMIYPGDGSCWYMKDNILCRNSVSGGEERPVDSRAAAAKWTVWNGSGAYYPGNWSALTQVDGVLYYTGPTAVYSYDPATGTAGTLYSYAGGRGYVYGMTETEDGSALLLTVRQGPAAPDQETVRVPLERQNRILSCDVREDGTVTARVTCTDDARSVLCGVYAADGRMTGARRIGVLRSGSYSFDFSGVSFDRAEVFLLDGNAAPLCGDE